MEKQYVEMDLFRSLANAVETLKDGHLRLSAKVAAHEAVISGLVRASNPSQATHLRSAIRDAAEELIARYDDEPHGQKLRADIAANTEALLRLLPPAQ